MKIQRSLAWSSVGLAAAVSLAAAMIMTSPAGADSTVGYRQHVVPATSPGTASSQLQTGNVSYPQSSSYSQAPGNVTYQHGGVVTGPVPDPTPADLVSASASDNGNTLQFTAKTPATVPPTSDPNWRKNTYVGWAIDPNFSGKPLYRESGVQFGAGFPGFGSDGLSTRGVQISMVRLQLLQHHRQCLRPGHPRQSHRRGKAVCPSDCRAVERPAPCARYRSWVPALRA